MQFSKNILLRVIPIFIFYLFPFIAKAGDLKGMWIKKNTGEVIDFKSDDFADIFAGRIFNDKKNIKYISCTKYGGNVCFISVKFKCSFRYSFTKNVLNLQYRYTQYDNQKFCMSLYGDYTKVDK
jgi:hypothetical protein